MEQYSLSIYETLYPMEDTEGHYILSNGLYGALDIITGEEAKLISSGSFGELSSATAGRLKARGHLIREGEDETENASILSRTHWLVPYTKFINIVVLPTYNCNFRCSYCFERFRLEKGQNWLSHQMSEETFEAIIGQLESMRKHGITIRSIMLFGGEPLLVSNMKLVRKWVDYSVRNGIPYSVISNGYEMERFLDIFREHPPKSIQITVDGPAAVHDRRRYLAGGKGSFAKIMENIGKAIAIGVPINVRTNVNRSNLQSAMSLPEEYRRLGFFDNPNFHWYFKATIGCYEADPANAISDEELFHEMLRSGFSFSDAVSHCCYSAAANVLTNNLNGKAYPALRPAFCGANADMITVDPDGILYPCWNVVSMEEYAVGLLDTDKQRFVYSFDFAKWRNRTADKIEPCRTCPYIMFCGGGCAIEAKYLNGKLQSGICGDTRAIYHEVLPVLCRDNYLKTGQDAPGFSWYDLFIELTPEDRRVLLTTTDSSTAWALVKKYMTKTDRIFS